jgi:hypothetical protein
MKSLGFILWAVITLVIILVNIFKKNDRKKGGRGGGGCGGCGG